MARKKSLVPIKAQIPLALCLAVAFALVLAWRFRPQDERKAAAAPQAKPAATAEATDSPVAIDDLRALLKKIKTGEKPAAPAETPMQAPIHDPFRTPPPEVAPAVVEAPPEPEIDPAVQAIEARARRDTALENLKLTGTCLAGSERVALINGRCLRPGASVDGFQVREVREREVVLEDEFGPAVVRLFSIAWLPAADGGFEPQIQKEIATP
jgi:hypothetical protein